MLQIYKHPKDSLRKNADLNAFKVAREPSHAYSCYKGVTFAAH